MPVRVRKTHQNKSQNVVPIQSERKKAPELSQFFQRFNACCLQGSRYECCCLFELTLSRNRRGSCTSGLRTERGVVWRGLDSVSVRERHFFLVFVIVYPGFGNLLACREPDTFLGHDMLN